MKILFLLSLVISCNALAAGKRIEVTDQTQAIWDVKTGQSLSLICQQLHAATSQSKCQQTILALNPHAFINNDINRLLAGARLRLPGGYQSVSRLDPRKYTVQTFSWGNIKTPK